MAIQGKFIISAGATYSPLIIYGVGVFQAFSGNGAYRNNGACGHVPNNGPIPPGRYHIVKRPHGSVANMGRAAFSDFISGFTFNPVDHGEWFGLYRIDGAIDDTTFIENVERGAFRLHPGDNSKGCITLPSRSDFLIIRYALLRQKEEAIPNTDLKSYGTIEVITYDTTCP